MVVGDFQGSGSLNGFFVQEEDTNVDGDAATSEGIFVFDPANAVALEPNDLVRVRGTVAEFSGLTEITNVAAVRRICSRWFRSVSVRSPTRGTRPSK